MLPSVSGTVFIKEKLEKDVEVVEKLWKSFQNAAVFITFSSYQPPFIQSVFIHMKGHESGPAVQFKTQFQWKPRISEASASWRLSKAALIAS